MSQNPGAQRRPVDGALRVMLVKGMLIARQCARFTFYGSQGPRVVVAPKSGC